MGSWDLGEGNARCRTRLVRAVGLLALAALVGCSDGGTPGGGGADGSHDSRVPIPAVELGEPFAAEAFDWTWVPIAGTSCRDGSGAGVMVNLNPDSDALVIALEGGGACYDALSCYANPQDISEEKRANFAEEYDSGLFDRENAENPIGDWNVVFVPYCTGDMHLGAEANGDVDGKLQRFVGYTNMTALLSRIVPSFPNATRVLLTGGSAGGVGAAVNYFQVARYFDPVPVDMLNDAGPTVGSPWVATCLQDWWRRIWNMDATLLRDCGVHCPASDDYMLHFVKWTAEANPERSFGILSSVEDPTVRSVLGSGANDCESARSLSREELMAGLLDVRARMATIPNFGTYYFPGGDHATLHKDEFYDRETAEGTRLQDWVVEFLGGRTSNVGP